MKTIWKYPLEGFSAEIKMPAESEVLTLQIQNQNPVMWVEVDDTKPLVTRRFKVIGTGQEVPRNSWYVNTFQDGPWVWHVFEVLVK